jgi:hypothetical protein
MRRNCAISIVQGPQVSARRFRSDSRGKTLIIPDSGNCIGALECLVSVPFIDRALPPVPFLYLVFVAHQTGFQKDERIWNLERRAGKNAPGTVFRVVSDHTVLGDIIKSESAFITGEVSR